MVDTASHGLGDCIEMLSVGCDPEDEDKLANASLLLRRLVNDRSFLGDLLIEQLKASHREGGNESGYGPQAIVLSPNMGSFFLLANIWPSENEACFRASDAVTGILNPTSTECFLRWAIGIGSEEVLDFAEWVGKPHPSDRLRLASYEARCGLLDKVGQDALWRQAEHGGSRMLAAEAASRRVALQARLTKEFGLSGRRSGR